MISASYTNRYMFITRQDRLWWKYGVWWLTSNRTLKLIKYRSRIHRSTTSSRVYSIALVSKTLDCFENTISFSKQTFGCFKKSQIIIELTITVNFGSSWNIIHRSQKWSRLIWLEIPPPEIIKRVENPDRVSTIDHAMWIIRAFYLFDSMP